MALVGNELIYMSGAAPAAACVATAQSGKNAASGGSFASRLASAMQGSGQGGNLSPNSPLIYASDIGSLSSSTGYRFSGLDSQALAGASSSRESREAAELPDHIRDLEDGMTVTDDHVYFKGDFIAGIDLSKGGVLNELWYDGEQLLSGNGMWMHSSPEGAADSTGLGFEMSTNSAPTVTVDGNTVTVEGLMYQSNGSGLYSGQNYRRTYTFDQQGSFKVSTDMWVDAEDVQRTVSENGYTPKRHYVWANPLDANLSNYYWNADGSWEGANSTWNYSSSLADSGLIPEAPDGWTNWGVTSVPELMGKNPTAALYNPGGAAIVREITSGDMAQINFWGNTAMANDTRTVEFSSIGGDRRYFDENYDIPGELTGGQSYSYSERIRVGSAADLIPSSSSGSAWRHSRATAEYLRY